VELSKSAPTPRAVLLFPLLRSSDATPTAVLKLPVVTLNCENAPNALFAKPVVINGIALCPSLVFNTPGAGGFGTGAASALDENAKQASADRMRHTGVTFLNCRMSVFI
jgi:hypothetical protein